ncbi:DUF3189 family protein [Desulforamulus aeronauticus]|uniref:DUF3189 domain-containing protein n=1 Tax=Desulforamulus aeronauticus DSM 10349 TaxID=1121421 RepID=A0A1M6S1Z9_9FIRM|nr:DUF3189 family protein [Desulforamulus aeronauticus]SHK38567.1 Protein of unknown function [Desulforamulus aeronauticus DSM 10349]
MLIIYYDVGGAHSVQTAAGIHLNVLPQEGSPQPAELFKMKKFDNITKADYGRIIYAGTDEWGNNVYTLSCQYASPVVVPAIRDMHRLAGGNPHELLMVSTLGTINTLMKIGGFTSRRLKWVSFGRPIVVRGTLQAYPQIALLVSEVKELLPKLMEDNSWLKNSWASTYQDAQPEEIILH